MSGLGVLINARAGRVRKDAGLVKRIARLLPPGHVDVTETTDEIEEALVTLAGCGIDTLAIVGGDGTCTGTFTPLARVWPTEPPRLLLLAAGSVNTIPRALGLAGAPDRVLERLLRGRRPLHERRRTVLKVRAGDGLHVGLIFGNGVVARWLAHYYAGSLRGPVGAALGVAEAVTSIARGSDLARELVRPFAAKVEVDGHAFPLERFTGMAAGALRTIGLGFRPFLSAGRTLGRFHWIGTEAGALGLGLELPWARLGIRPPGSALRHATATDVRVRLEQPQPYTIDGDLFPPATALAISAGPTLSFLGRRRMRRREP